MNNNIIKVYNNNNEIEEIEVIDIFQLEEYDHEYILYTKNEIDGDNVITYVSIITEISQNEFRLDAITNKEEAEKVDAEIEKEINALINQ